MLSLVLFCGDVEVCGMVEAIGELAKLVVVGREDRPAPGDVVKVLLQRPRRSPAHRRCWSHDRFRPESRTIVRWLRGGWTTLRSFRP